MKKLIIPTALIIVGMLSVFSAVLADERTLPLPTADGPLKQMIKNEHQKSADGSKDIKEIKLSVRSDIKTEQDHLKTARDQFEQKKQELKKEVETKLQDAKKKAAKETGDLHKKLQEKVKDKTKQTTVENIGSQIQELNTRLVGQYTAILDQIEGVLKKVESRTDDAAAKGSDVSSVRTAVEAARKSITDSRAAVAAQAGKTYLIQISTENNLKIDVGKARQALYGDLAKTRDTVKAAREAVRKAATTLAKISKPTPTPSQAPNTSPASSSENR